MTHPTVSLLKTSAHGVTAQAPGQPSTRIPWSTLRAAATQDDHDLRMAYADLLGRAEVAEAARVRRALHPGCTVVACVRPDSSGLGYEASVVWRDTGSSTPRAVDEGGTCHGGGYAPFRIAVLEAESRARRSARPDQIGREGYTTADYDTAAALLADGRSLADGRKIA